MGVTLARAGSKGVPNKHLRNLAGKPLIDYTLDLVPDVPALDDYLVSTNSIEIQKHVLAKGYSSPFLRPQHLSTDTASSVSALQHAVTFMEKRNGAKYDFVIELMATNPFKNSNDVNICIQKLINDDLDSVIAVHRIFDNHPSRVKRIVDGMLVDFCVPEVAESRRQDLQPHAFIRSGAIYALKRQMLMEKGLRYGTPKCGAYIMPENRSINIDDEIDFLYSELILGKISHE